MRLLVTARHQRFSADTYPDLSDAKLLFDTNVWLLIQGYFTNHKDPRVRLYSGFYEAALESGAQLFIPQTVISEFVNRAVRSRAFESGWDGKGKIHHHQQYDEWIDDASNDVHHISTGATFLSDGFSEVKFDSIVEMTKESTLDFNDILIKEMCNRCGLVLVTDDSDFRGQDVTLLTGNPKLVS